jgi:hypothetical protein
MTSYEPSAAAASSSAFARVRFDEAKSGPPLEPREPRLLQRRIVVGVQRIDAAYLVSLIEKAPVRCDPIKPAAPVRRILMPVEPDSPAKVDRAMASV